MLANKPPPRLLDRVREKIRLRHYSYRTEKSYIGWIRRYIIFHGRRHPSVLGGPAVEAFLTHLAVHGRVSASTQNQALAAILFLYRDVLEQDLPWLTTVVRARRPRRRPVVLTREEVPSVLANMSGQYWLIASLLYGSGLRLLEVLHLRCKDLNLAQHIATVFDGKGQKDRVAMIPTTLVAPLQLQIAAVTAKHAEATRLGYARVELPSALARKYPRAPFELGWQYLFPASAPSRDPRSGAWRRHHLHESAVQRNVKAAVRAAKLDKPATCHTFRHCFAPFDRVSLRHSHSPGTPGTQQRPDDDDLHARTESRRPWCDQPDGRGRAASVKISRASDEIP